MKILQNYKKAIILRIYFLLRDNLARLVLHPFFVSISLFRGYSVFTLLYLKLTTLETILKVVKIFAQACIEMTCIETTDVRPFSSSRRHCISSLTTFASWQEPLNLHS